MADPLFQNFMEHATIFLAGSTGMALVGHAVQTFPPQKNPYANWLLGVVQFLVGQRYRSANTFEGVKSMTIPGGKVEGDK